MGNLADFLNGIGDSSKSTLDNVSNLLGTVADISGAVGGVGAVVSLVESFVSSEADVETILSNILTTIQDDFAQLNKAEAASYILQRNSVLNGYLGGATTALKLIPGILNQQPPVSGAERIPYIQACSQALDQLNGGPNVPDEVWYMVWSWQVFWTDADDFIVPVWGQQPDDNGNLQWVDTGNKDIGYGSLAPQADSSGDVFCYNYALPSYALAGSIFLTVASALDPNYVTDYSDTILDPYLVSLQARHDTIVAAITLLVPDRWSNQGGMLFLAYSGTKGLQTTLPWNSPVYTDADGNQQYAPNGALVYFGAVEQYSGYSSMVTNYDASPVDPSLEDLTYNRLLLQALGQAKKVYEGVGLPSVIASIDQINQILGRPGTPAARYNDWSLTRDVFPTLGLSPQGGLLAAVRALLSVPPFATTSGPQGLRSLLSVN